jgi:hypothetical protein
MIIDICDKCDNIVVNEQSGVVQFGGVNPPPKTTKTFAYGRGFFNYKE